MNNKQIQEMLTVEGWGRWLRYVKANNVKNIGGIWPDYDFHEFYTSLNIEEADSEPNCGQGGSCTKGSEPVASSDTPEDYGRGGCVGLCSNNNIPERRETQDGKSALPEPGDGPKGVGPSGEQEGRVQDGLGGCLGS